MIQRAIQIIRLTRARIVTVTKTLATAKFESFASLIVRVIRLELRQRIRCHDGSDKQ
jgi:hypothetical protein